MNILSKNSLIKYVSSEILNLMEAPPKDSENNLYADYNIFINNVLAIYETQTINGNIPVFITKPLLNSNSGERFPDPDSTLRSLKPGRSYRVIMLSGSSLPVRVPNPIGLKEFLDDPINESKENCDKINVNSPYDNNTISLSSGVLSHNINIPLNKLQKNSEYSFSFSPLFSNWPAKITPMSGTIRKSGPIAGGYTSGNIDAIFSYYPYLLDNLDSIPYIINGDINKDYYTDNVATILNLNIKNDNCTVYSDNYIVEVSGSIEDHSVPQIVFEASQNNDLDQQKFIHATISGLNPNIEYSFEFDTLDSNWPTNISPQSGIIKRKNIKNGTATIHSVLTFCQSLYDNDANLDYSPSIISDDNNTPIKKMNNLSLTIHPINASYFNKVSESILYFYNPPTNPTSIRFDRGSPDIYPILSGSNASRPTSELSASSSSCCQDALALAARIDLPERLEQYTYLVSSYPQITIIPSSGTFGGSGTNNIIRLLAYLDGQKSSSVHITLIHDKSQNSVSDSIIVRCPQSNWTQ